MKVTATLTSLAPSIIKAAKVQGKAGIKSTTTYFPVDRRLIPCGFEVYRNYGPWGTGFNAIVMISGLPFELNPSKGTLKIRINVYTTDVPQHCEITIESITVDRGNPNSVNRKTLLRKLEADWVKGCP